MENITIALVLTLAAYLLFKAFTSTIDWIFKIIIGILIISFLGYTFLGWEDITAPTEELQDTNETGLLKPADTNQTITEEINETLSQMNATLEPNATS